MFSLRQHFAVAWYYSEKGNRRPGEEHGSAYWERPKEVCAHFRTKKNDRYLLISKHLRPARCRMAGAERRCPRKAKYKGNVMESQEQRAADSPNAGDEPNPATQSIDVAEVARADVRPSGAAASKHPPQIPLAPMKRMQARFNPLADGLMYLVVFVGGFVGVGFRRATDLLLPSVNGSPFVVGTFVSNMLACFLFAMLTEYMATASWLRRRVRQVVSRGVGLGLLGGLSTMSGVMLETMEGMREQRFGSALGYLAGSFAGGLIAAAVGVALMQALLARGTRKRVRNAIADASTASVSSMSDSGDSDAYGIVQDVQMTDTAVSATQSVTQTVPMADSGESDVPAAQNVQNNVPDACSSTSYRASAWHGSSPN